MKHYHSLQEVFEELQEENMQEIEGKVEISGKYYSVSGETFLKFRAKETPLAVYKILLEEYHKVDTRTLWSKD